MASKTYTVKFLTLGADLNDFQLSSNGGLVNPPLANRTQLLSGLTITVDEAATVLTVTSTGDCTNSTTVNLPATNPPEGGGGTPPCQGIASCITVSQSGDVDSGQTTICTDDFGAVISTGHPVMERTLTFTLSDCDGTPIAASTDIPISIGLEANYCGGPFNNYVSATIFAGQSSATYTFASSQIDNGGDYSQCGCFNTQIFFISATSVSYPIC